MFVTGSYHFKQKMAEAVHDLSEEQKIEVVPYSGIPAQTEPILRLMTQNTLFKMDTY